MFKIHKQQKDFTEIHRLDFGNNFKWEADDSDHHMVCVEGKFRQVSVPWSCPFSPRG